MPALTSAKLLPAALDLIRHFEGCNLRAYYSGPGMDPTIGVGHTKLVTREHVQRRVTITRADADFLLRWDLREAEWIVQRHVMAALEDHQYSALVSFVFNIGERQFRSSTMLAELNGDFVTRAAAQFDRWIYDAGKALRGLELRRKAERLMFEGEDWAGAMT